MTSDCCRKEEVSVPPGPSHPSVFQDTSWEKPFSCEVVMLTLSSSDTDKAQVPFERHAVGRLFSQCSFMAFQLVLQ